MRSFNLLTMNLHYYWKVCVLHYYCVFLAEVRVRVRAECAESATTLESVASEKMSELERRLDRFAQANSILRARELAGNLVLSLRLGELPALEALARDASDGRLLHSLSRVFLADSLRSTLNNEPLRLMVALDDDDYENARCTLAQNIWVCFLTICFLRLNVAIFDLVYFHSLIDVLYAKETRCQCLFTHFHFVRVFSHNVRVLSNR